MPQLVVQWLKAYGLDNSLSFEGLKSASLQDLPDPASLTDLSLAARLLSERSDEKILIYGDYDLDGTSGAALLVEGLRQLGFQDVRPFQPDRFLQGYGLHSEVLRDFSNEGIQTVVTVDLGITAIEQAKVARELGLKLIITDHHQPLEELPEAEAVVNPNRKDCSSELGYLCGAGVAFYLILELRRHLKARGKLRAAFNPKELLDLFIIGTLTDVVPLVGANRTLTKHGLIQLQKTKRPGLRALLEALQMADRALSAEDVSIGLAPKLNALSRLNTELRPLDVLLEQDIHRAYTKVKTILQTNQKRKDLQKKAVDKALLQADLTQTCIFAADKEFHPGVLGLIATKLCEHSGKPAYVLGPTEEGVWLGSARSPKGSGLSVLEGLRASGEDLVKFGGHHAASGFEATEDRFEGLKASLQAYFQSPDPIREEKQEFVLEAKLSEVNSRYMRWMDTLGPFGEGFEEPVLQVREARVRRVLEMKGGHFKLKLSELGGTEQWDAVLFSPGAEEQKKLKCMVEGELIDLKVRPAWNYFAGKKTLQLFVLQLL